MLKHNKKLDAVLVAGEEESSYKVSSQHKATLKIKGKCIINYVVEALQQVDSLERIFIVGMRDKLLAVLEEGGIDLNYPKPITVVSQKNNLYENIWHTFLLHNCIDNHSFQQASRLLQLNTLALRA